MSSSPNSSSSSSGEISSTVREAFRDVPVVIEVLLGRGSMPLGQLVALTRGTVLRLDQAAGADLVVSATGIPLALGEVVVIEDSVAARVTHVLARNGETAS